MSKTLIPHGLALSLLLAAGAAAAERSWTYRYHPDTEGPYGTVPGQLASADGPRTDVADITRYDYDAQGNLIRVTDALDHVTQITAHDPSGRPLTLVDPNGLITELRYDPRGRLLTRTTGGQTTTFGYDPVGNLTSLQLPTGVTLSYVYDDARRLTAIVDGAGNRIDYVLDAAGNRREERIADPSGQLRYLRRQVFDELSRLRQVIANDGGSDGFDYDANGNLVATRDGLGNPTSHAFDALNRLERSTDALQGQTLYSYDAQDNLTGVQDPRGGLTQYVYDGLGNLTQLISPDTGTTIFEHDAAGNVIRRTDARGVVSEFDYDALNRPTAIRYPAAPNRNVSLSYDTGGHGIGRLAEMREPIGVSLFHYTPRGRLAEQLTQVGGHSYSVRYDYDAADQLTAITYPSGRIVRLARDATGRIAGVTSELNGVLTPLASAIGYAPFGPLASLTYGNGLQLARDYDLDYRLDQLSLASLDARDYRYSQNGNVSAIDDLNDPAHSQAFDYDALSRLTQAIGAYGSLDWGYDPIGNRLWETHDGARDDYAYESPGSQLLAVSGAEPLDFDYDASGRMLRRGELTLHYHHEGRLWQVRRNGTTLASYAYNGFQQRVRKVVNGVHTVYLYDPAGQLLAEVDGLTGQTRKEYVWLDGMPLAVLEAASGQTYYVHADHLNTPRMLTDATGQVVWEAAYAPFGAAAVVSAAGVEFNLRLPGQYFDQETGLHYNWHRYYDPHTGRYIRSDPIGLRGGLNTYAYVLGNPISSTDPLGLWTFSVGLSGSFQQTAAGASATGALGLDSSGQFCAQFTTCGRVGPGQSAGATVGFTLGEGTFCEGNSASGGIFGEGGSGLFGGGSIDYGTGGASGTGGANIGIGGGWALGSQACITRTWCF